MYEKVVQQAGLDEKQAKVYLACLELGQSKVPEIARKSGIKRTTAYGILDELVGLGLVSVSTRGRLKFFKAQDPRSLVEILETNKKAIEGALPGLESLFATHHLRPRLQFFEGREGMKRILEDSLKCKSKKILQIMRVKDWNEFLGPQTTSEYIARRAAKDISAYALHPVEGDVHDVTYGKESEQWKRQVRYLPLSAFYASMIMIYDHKVVMISTKAENFGFIIESKEFANTFRTYFDFMWSVGSK